AVLFDSVTNEVYSLTRGEVTEGVVAPIYYPATFYYSYLVDHNVVPDIDSDAHLLIALPNAEMSEEMIAEECKDTRNIVRKAVEWVVSLVGIVQVSSNPCIAGGSGGGGGASGPSGENNRPSISMSVPNPLQRGGGGSGGGMGNGAGGGGGSMSPEGGSAGGG